MISLAAITFDVDWAPEWCIELCRDLCIDFGIPGTFYATHKSDVIKELRDDSRFEIGIHPNFLENSSHGREMKEVIEFTLDLVPNARSMRTHALYESTLLYRTIADSYQQIETDTSIFLPFERDIKPLDYHVGLNGNGITRLPFYWEDDIMAEWPNWSWTSKMPDQDGLKIFDFHPMYLGMNIHRMSEYRDLKVRLGSRPLYTATKEDCAGLFNEGVGDLDFVKQLLRSRSHWEFATISDIADHYKTTKVPQ